jgi:uncharacterized SAM-binding protein YcdF (DUF218 family)
MYLKKILRFLLFIFVCAVLTWLGGFLLFIHTLPQTVPGPDIQADAIVVLTGSPCRVTTGAQLLAKGYADQLFISGVPEQLSKRTVLLGGNCPSYFSEGELADLLPRTSVGNQATSTMENAHETLKWVQQNNIKTIRLVTSALHLPRSLIEFQRLMPEIKIIAHPVTQPSLMEKNWYHSWPVFSKLALEYNKYLLVHLPWLQKEIALRAKTPK